MPTDDNFDYPAIETTTMAMSLADKPFFKEKPLFGYLIAVKPGTYFVYGPIGMTDNGNAGVCMCMGTVKFDVRPGEIADVGFVGVAGVPTGSPPPIVEPYARPLQTEIRSFEGPLPARLQGLPVHPVTFSAVGKLPNYLGVTIDRLYPMPGVLDYRRDRVINVRAGAELP